MCVAKPRYRKTTKEPDTHCFWCDMGDEHTYDLATHDILIAYPDSHVPSLSASEVAGLNAVILEQAFTT